MRNFKFLLKENVNETYPEGILNGYYNYNMPYDDLRPFYKCFGGVDIFSEVNETTWDELDKLDKFVYVRVLGVMIDGRIYSSIGVNDEWEFPENWNSNGRYIYEYMLVPHAIMRKSEETIEDDSWEEIVFDSYYPENVELPQREEHEPMEPDSEGVFIRMSDRLVMLEDVIKYNL